MDDLNKRYYLGMKQLRIVKMGIRGKYPELSARACIALWNNWSDDELLDHAEQLGLNFSAYRRAET